MLLLGVMCLPAFIIAVITNVTASITGGLPLPYSAYTFTTQAILTIFVAAHAPESLSGVLRVKTVPLYSSRPLERSDYVLPKFGRMAPTHFPLLPAPVVIINM